MAVIIVLLISFALQLGAAVYVLFLMKNIGGRVFWIALGTAIFLMAVRRGLSLSTAILTYPNPPQTLSTELVALIISSLIMLAVIMLEPLINNIAAGQRKLEKEIHRNSVILSSTPDGVCVLNEHNIITEVNPAYCEMLGYQGDELLGSQMELYDPTCGEMVRDLRQRIAEKGLTRFEFIQFKASGEMLHVDVTAQFTDAGENSLYLFFRDVTQRCKIESELGEFRNTLDQTLDGVFIFSAESRQLQYANQGAVKIVGYDREEILQMGPGILQPEADKKSVNDMCRELIIGDRKLVSYEVELRHKNGEHVPVEVFLQYVMIPEAGPRFIAIVRDVSERIQAEQELFAQREKALVTLSSIGDGVITTDMQGRVDFMNSAAERLCRIAHTEVTGKPLPEVCTLVYERDRNIIANPIEKVLQHGGTVSLNGSLILISHDPDIEYSVEVVVSPIFNQDNTIIGTVLVLHDTTELRGMAQQLSYQATHDSLTGLINRREFENRLEMDLHSAKRYASRHVLFYMDLDQFKIINDTCGHMAGDEMLIQVTSLLQHCVRETDTLARLGGDEFGVLLSNCDIDKAREVADKILQRIRDFRYTWDENIFEIGVSIGIVSIDEHSGEISDLLSAADSACYVAKERGGNTSHLYLPGDKELAIHHGHMRWYQQIQRALEDNRFRLYAQLIHSLDPENEDAMYCELLLRMVSEQGDIITPQRFLPAAERYHMMQAIDRWVLKDVFRMLTTPGEVLYAMQGRCSVNLSGQSLGESDFLDYVLQLAEKTKVKLDKICFEITETAVISNITQARQFISELRKRGCCFALDDFGSGLSSFSYLKNLNVDYLKIDGSFVLGMLNDGDDFNMVSTINHIGHSLGLKTIAESVETQAMVDSLRTLGVDYIQGYVVGRPNPLEYNEEITGPCVV